MEKDKVAYEAVMGKIQEVSVCEDVEHYKICDMISRVKKACTS